MQSAAPAPGAMVLRRVLPAALVSLAAWALLARAGEATATGGAAHDLVLLDGAPYVELELGGARGLFLFDTGANTSGVDAGWLEEHGVPHRAGAATTVGGTTGVATARRAVFERLDLGTGFFGGPSFVVQDFGGFAAPPGRRQAGLLGTDFLNAYQVDLDYLERRVRLALAGERRPLPSTLAPTTLTYEAGLPTVTARLAGVDLPCRLDTGGSYRRSGVHLDVNAAAVRALRRAGVELEPAGSIGVVGVGGPRRLQLLRAPEGLPLEVGPARLDDVTLVVHDAGTLAGDRPLALATASVMTRWERFVVDPFDRLIWLPRSRRRGPV